jgi:hypothetical protein
MTKESKANQWQRSGLSKQQISTSTIHAQIGAYPHSRESGAFKLLFYNPFELDKKDSSKPKKKKKKIEKVLL